ncbi:MAG: helix-turn-helix domain-containing protein [Candidatus Woesearchaeota archaeon]|jgi:sugar-specific transcriptional regulator TrmB|nr:helix-turn-helix domain-containing protein [Candidatus Woesearchaeota archaeon]MDP7198162.1 helix-turn-helix domain-containing protein [Candidatus Woesearchaeota archaeon]MDP7466997.1 helix-turn-helix domain-containing protein [Candidatus Woesearchaeota archaeon]MDP7646667.1 helix-turn-helix domain-containing protein [Candidatus Woesearchaeota archaeon]
MNTAVLEDLGLTGAEIKVFLTLLEVGSSSAGPVVGKSGLHNAVVHRALHSLADKGLVTYVLEGKTRRYASVAPNHLLAFIDEKKEKLKALLPELDKRRSLATARPQGTVFQGARGVRELMHILLDTQSKEYYSYGGARISAKILGSHFWDGFHRRRIDKDIKAKLLFHSSIKDWSEYLQKKKLTTVRLIPQKFDELTETIICGDRVGINIYTDKPFGFLIEESAAAASYKGFFDMLWKQGV